MSVTLASSGFRLTLDPGMGGAILSVEWLRPEGDPLPLLAPWDASMPPFKAGCFAMLPFANRISDGRFQFQGHKYQLPINNTSENVAIHGFGREDAWELTSHAADAATVEQSFDDEEIPYRYHAKQEIRLTDNETRIDVSVRNDGDAAMPFGIGLHPWFVKTPDAKLSFAARGTFARDERGLPVEPLSSNPAFEADTTQPLGKLPWLDACFVDWQPRQAQLLWPESKTELTIAADGALRHLHVYLPDDRAVVCAEPVSQIPDAINRPELGYPMDILKPGETLSGAMTLSVRTYSPD